MSGVSEEGSSGGNAPFSIGSPKNRGMSAVPLYFAVGSRTISCVDAFGSSDGRLSFIAHFPSFHHSSAAIRADFALFQHVQEGVAVVGERQIHAPSNPAAQVGGEDDFGGKNRVVYRKK